MATLNVLVFFKGAFVYFAVCVPAVEQRERYKLGELLAEDAHVVSEADTCPARGHVRARRS